MGSEVIYAVLVALWAAYLIPLWLRHRAESTESRSVDRFSHAMRILSRRTRVPGTRDVVLPRRAPQPLRPDGEALVTADLARPRARSARRASLAARRRRTLLALLAVTLLSVVVTVAGLVGWPAPAGVLALTVLYLAHLRVEARRSAAQPRRRSGPRERDLARQRWEEVRRVARREPEPARRVSSPARSASPNVPAPVAAAAETAGAGSPTRPLPDPRTFWEPVPVPLPTYVTAPKAVRPSRVIDLTRPGAWSHGQAIDRPLQPENASSEGVSEPASEASREQARGPNEEGFGPSRRVVND